MRWTIICLLGFMTVSVALAQTVSPEKYLGRPVGTDFQLADWQQVSGYFDQLASEHARVRVKKIGKTTEGRDFRVAIISSEENLANLDVLKGYAQQLADPRGLQDSEALLQKARLFLFISNNMHSTEIASPEMSMQLAYTLATSNEEPWVSARRELVIVMTPSTNPDGFDQVVKWYRENQGTPFETARLPELYQRYAGHDNNRDWFMNSLKETRLVTKLLYSEWFPQVYWDVHQMGQNGARLFFPPFRDPMNPNLDGSLVSGINTIGSRVMFDLTSQGYSGVSSNVGFDMWWNGGNRTVPVRHNMMGFLSEMASANLASPIYIAPENVRSPNGILKGNIPSNKMPSPWKGGWWRIGDIIEYELAIARSMLGTLSRERQVWLKLSLDAATRAIQVKEAPSAWLIPTDNPDPGAVRRLLDTLMLGGVEVHVAKKPFHADDLEYPAGTLVLKRAQPYGTYIKDLFEVQRFPEGTRPYDVSGWTLPLLMGVHRVAITNTFEVEADLAADVDDAMAGLVSPPKPAYAWPHLDGDDSRSLKGVAALLKADIPVYYDANPKSSRPGSWAIAPADQAKAAQLLEPLLVPLVAADAKAKGSIPAQANGFHASNRLPRIGLYAPWSGSMDEGWTRWVFDYFGLSYTRLRNEHLRGGNLNNRFDVIVIPSVRSQTLHDGRKEGSVSGKYAGGLNPEGSMALHAFVSTGGTLVSIGGSGDYVNEVFALGLTNTAVTKRNDKDGFSCPGSILRTIPNADSPWSAGLPPSQPVFFANARAWKLAEGKGKKQSAEMLLTFPKSRLLLSGWIRKPEAIADSAAWLRIPFGEGQIQLFGIRPAYRSWTHGNFRLLFRAILVAPH